MTVGGAMQHLLAEPHSGRDRLRDRHRGAAASTWPTPGLRVLNGTDLASRAEVVVVAGTEELVYDDLRNAALAVPPRRRLPGHRARPHLPAAGRPLARHGRDPRGRGGTATSRTAEIVGKPEPQLFVTALDRLGDGRTLVVGDRVDTDLAAAAAAGLDAALVLSGGGDRTALDGVEPQPVAVGETLAGCWLDR